MRYYTSTIEQYLNDLAARKPAPGGGSAAALVGATAVALLSMVANFTVGKERYRENEAEIKRILEALEKIRKRLSELIDEDVEVYGSVSEAYRMPKEKEEEKCARHSAIQAAFKNALSVPLEICRLSDEAMKLCAPLREKGNKNLLSDVDVAEELLKAAFNSAVVNVEINLDGIEDGEFVGEIKKELWALKMWDKERS